MKWTKKVLQWASKRDREKVLSDANRIGFDSIRGGLLTLVINLFVPTQIGMIGALTFLLGGLIIWIVTLPKRS